MQFRTLAAISILGLSVGRAQGLTDKYRPVADRLINAAMADNEGYQRLTYLCYRIGSRLSGSASLQRAIEWSAEQMKAAGLIFAKHDYFPPSSLRTVAGVSPLSSGNSRMFDIMRSLAFSTRRIRCRCSSESRLPYWRMALS
jgi:hypothetical protein